MTKRNLISLIQRFAQNSSETLNLSSFLRIFTQVKLEDIYKHGGWSSLLLASRPNTLNDSANEANLAKWSRGLKNRLLRCDALNYLQFIQELSAANFCLQEHMNKSLALMCHYDLWGKTGEELGFSSLAESLKALDEPLFRSELNELIPLLINRIQHRQKPMPMMQSNPLLLHARYAREQILAAFGAHTFTYRAPGREGVFAIPEQNSELLFVTLTKNTEQFSPSTMYHDYAISEELFHWQSQNSARPDTGRGLSYIQQTQNGKRIFLFVRKQTEDADGNTLGFVNFGEVYYVSHSGSKPMNINWRLRDPMPAFMWQDAAKLAVA